MKKILPKFLLLLGVGGAFSACNNDLDEKVYSDVTESTYGYDNVYGATGIVYARMRDLFGHTTYYMLQETSSDELVQPANASGWDDGGIYKRIHLHTWNSTNPQLNNLWNTLYQGTLNANRVIDQLQTGKIPLPSTGASKEALVAEMRVARAFFYWLILDNFGDAPLVNTLTTELPAKATRKEIYQFVVTEITASLPALSEDTGPLLYGRFNKWAAKALLANVYLNAKVYVGEEKWTDCLAQCNDIIGKYSLDPTYRAVFKTDNEKSPEIVFAVPFDENRGGGFFPEMFSWHGALKAKSNMQATPWGFGSAMGVPQFIDTYDPADERLADTWLMGQQYALDGSAIQTSGKPFVLTKELPDGLFTGETEGFRMNKFEVKVGALSGLSNDFPFFRYAEVLMMKAECLLRTGDAAGAATLVSQVRAQHGFKKTPGKAAVTAAELAQNSRYRYGYVEKYAVVDPGNTAAVPYGRFLDELGWEFAWEGHRRRDMIRFGTFTTKSWLSHKPQGDYRTVFPIPQIQIGANPNISQNPSYQ